MSKAERLRQLALQSYWAAETPKEAKMAGILIDLFAPDVRDDDRPLPRVKVVFA
jgi:hypothetical protein